MAKTTKTTEANLQDRQAEIPDMLAAAESLVAALRQADSCESAADFDVNLDDAADQLLDEAIKGVRS